MEVIFQPAGTSKPGTFKTSCVSGAAMVLTFGAEMDGAALDAVGTIGVPTSAAADGV